MIINSVGNYQANRISHKNYDVQTSSAPANNAPAAVYQTPFRGVFSDVFMKKFSTPQEAAMYRELNGVLQGKDKTNLDILYKTGKLADRNSNDKSSTLENLYKIYKNPRITGLDNGRILSETLERIANPFVINQRFGQIPDSIGKQVLQEKKASTESAKGPYEPKSLNDMNIKNSASCVAASIEFSLADKKPAEFARFAEGLSSPEMAVNHNVKHKNLSKNMLESITLLQMFSVVPKKSNWDEVSLKIRPDRDAIIRARVQNTYVDGKSRGSVDVLMQSAFMQLGSQATYNSLTDKRYGSLNANNTGLTEFEKTFVESVIDNDGEKTSMVYQNVDNNAVLQGYFFTPEQVKDQLLKTLAKNKNIIIGITETDENKKIIGGHEITVIGSKMKGKDLYLVCNDTDDNYTGSVEIKADNLIPKIHHAGIPVDIADAKPEENRGNDLLKQYAQKNSVA